MERLTHVKHSWGIAIRALGKNRLQTALTMTGMTIGVATVLTMRWDRARRRRFWTRCARRG
jgi:putative ABC transport system permease protein